jgi:hypothetical protein
MNTVEHQRDTELENIVGNLLIAEYQVEKLRDRVVDKIGGRYTRLADKKQSTYIFKSNGSWVKVSINVEKIAIDETPGIQDDIQETGNLDS